MAMAIKRIHWFQHVPFEGLGYIEHWAADKGHRLTVTRFYDGDVIPDVDAYDWLVVMGGPMGVAQERQYPWLAAEKKAILQAVEAGKAVLGICLGAQLIAEILGGRISRNPHKEIGWYPIDRHGSVDGHSLAAFLPETLTVFHWHGDTFSLPPGARQLATSAACQQQGFVFGDRVVGLQFHMEITPAGAGRLVDQCADDLTPGPWVQRSDDILSPDAPYDLVHRAMDRLLTALAAVA